MSEPNYEQDSSSSEVIWWIWNKKSKKKEDLKIFFFSNFAFDGRIEHTISPAVGAKTCILRLGEAKLPKKKTKKFAQGGRNIYKISPMAGEIL